MQDSCQLDQLLLRERQFPNWCANIELSRNVKLLQELVRRPIEFPFVDNHASQQRFRTDEQVLRDTQVRYEAQLLEGDAYP
jgi:hypothetical protein